MTRDRYLAAVLVAVCAWGSSGCSALLLDRAPPRAEWASPERATCSGFAPAGSDLFVAGLIPLASTVELTEERRDPTTIALVTAAGAAMFLLSATLGVSAAERCAEYEHFKDQRALEAMQSRSPDEEGRGDEPCHANDDCIERLVCSSPGPLCPAPREAGAGGGPPR